MFQGIQDGGNVGIVGAAGRFLFVSLKTKVEKSDSDEWGCNF